jgi:hypothetical protein
MDKAGGMRATAGNVRQAPHIDIQAVAPWRTRLSGR